MRGKCNFQSPFRSLAVVTCEGNAMSVHHFLSKTLFMHYIDGEAVLLGGCWRFITLCGYKVGLSPVSSLHLTHIRAEIIFLSLLINHVLLKHILQRKANANIGKAGISKHSVFFLINYFFSRRKKIRTHISTNRPQQIHMCRCHKNFSIHHFSHSCVVALKLFMFSGL